MSEEVCTWCNAQIKDVRLAIEEYGQLALYIYLEGQGGCVMYCWDNLGKELDTLTTTGSMIYYLLKTAGVEEWSQIEGRYVRIGLDKDDRCCCLAHIVDDSYVFCIQDFIEIAKERKEGK